MDWAAGPGAGEGLARLCAGGLFLLCARLHVALAIGAIGLSLEGGATGSMAGAAGSLLVLLIFVRRSEDQRRFGILREKRGMASLAIVLLTLGVGRVVEGDVPGFRLEHELRRGRLVLRQHRGQAEHRKKEKVSEPFTHIHTRYYQMPERGLALQRFKCFNVRAAKESR